MHLKLPTNPTITVPSLDSQRFGVFSEICPSSTCWMPCFVDRYDSALVSWLTGMTFAKLKKVAMSAKFGEQHVHPCWLNSIISSKVLDELRRIKQPKS